MSTLLNYLVADCEFYYLNKGNNILHSFFISNNSYHPSFLLQTLLQMK